MRPRDEAKGSKVLELVEGRDCVKNVVGAV